MKQILLIDCGSSKVPEIEKILSELNVNFITKKFQDIHSVENLSGIIISGAPILLTETDNSSFIEKSKTIFINANLPILGICFGHQLMGIYHRAKVMRCKESRSWEKINFNPAFELLPGAFPSTEFMEDHCECITVPENFELLGWSGTCENEAMKHIKNPWFGVQFHPEVSGAAGYELIANFMGKVRSEK